MPTISGTLEDGLTLSTVMSMYILHEADENKFVEAANEILSRNKARRKTRLYEIRKARGFTQQQLATRPASHFA